MTARRRARRHWIRRLLGLVVMVLLGWLVWEAATWPDVRALATQPPTTTAFIDRYQALEERKIPRGASTITQQLAKNLWLTPSRSPLRKAREGVLTWQLERALSKRRILELYLNVVEFGPGVYGAEAAGRRYFGKPAAELDEDEAAQLAAALPKPRAWHPGVKTPSYRRYVENIRRRMDRAELPGKLLQ